VPEAGVGVVHVLLTVQDRENNLLPSVVCHVERRTVFYHALLK
jgi:hypothetical protein